MPVFGLLFFTCKYIFPVRLYSYISNDMWRNVHMWMCTAPQRRLPTAPGVCVLGWVKCREHISLLVILCIIAYVTNKAHLSLNYYYFFLLLEVALFNTQWLRDVSLKLSPGINQKNIIRTGLNGFTAEQLLCAVKYTFHCFENMVESANMSQWK